MTDEELYLQYLDTKDENALRELLLRYRGSLTYFIMGYIHNMEDAEEVMMDAFAQIAAGTSRFDPERKFKTWLFTIGRNMAISRKRRRNPETVSLEYTGESAYSIEGEYLQEERWKSLYRVMDTLNPCYRQILFLLYIEDMDTKEVMQIMKKNKKQVYNLTFQAKKALKEALHKEGFDDEEYR